MSKTFMRGQNTVGKPITPAKLNQQFFTKSKEHHKPIDFNLAWRQYAHFKEKQLEGWHLQGLTLLRKGREWRTKRLVNRWARERHTKTPEYFEPMITIDPKNPFRPNEEWPEAFSEDEKHTQFHERNEYPLLPLNPWALQSAKNRRSTGTYWREPKQKTWMERGLQHPHSPHPEFAGLTYCILRKNMEGLGAKGDVVAVHQDQFRYDLHPNRLAVVATRENCDLLGVAFDTLYQDYPRREQQGKLMHRQPWIWDQLQGMPWDEFTAPSENEAEMERDQPWDGEVPRPIFAAEMIARRKEEAAARKAEKVAAEEKIKERKRGAATQMFDL
eukprot:TRINITY_DN17313_c0_g1_i1.p1 TRINITY_DN17313_c0_g1~~TRINITY_DN17313_c0_g1_i1.p1  ORF type:complete len:329 (+),score=110.36 TRINITY_DN17313_c0_g1_i1:95-1081(+)